VAKTALSRYRLHFDRSKGRQINNLWRNYVSQLMGKGRASSRLSTTSFPFGPRGSMVSGRQRHSLATRGFCGLTSNTPDSVTETPPCLLCRPVPRAQSNQSANEFSFHRLVSSQTSIIGLTRSCAPSTAPAFDGGRRTVYSSGPAAPKTPSTIRSTHGTVNAITAHSARSSASPSSVYVPRSR